MDVELRFGIGDPIPWYWTIPGRGLSQYRAWPLRIEWNWTRRSAPPPSAISTWAQNPHLHCVHLHPPSSVTSTAGPHCRCPGRTKRHARQWIWRPSTVPDDVSVKDERFFLKSDHHRPTIIPPLWHANSFTKPSWLLLLPPSPSTASTPKPHSRPEVVVEWEEEGDVMAMAGLLKLYKA